MICEQCGGEFEPKKSNQKYCRVKCRNDSLYSRHREKIVARATAHKRKWRDSRLENVRCEYEACGVTFSQKRFGDRFCCRNHALAAWREKHPDLAKKYRRKVYDRTQKDAPWSMLIDAAKARAKKRGISFNLTKKWAAERWTGKCELTGIEFRQGGREERYFSASIDRVDCAKGYTTDNCRFVLWAINSFKHDATDGEMFIVAEALIRGHINS